MISLSLLAHQLRERLGWGCEAWVEGFTAFAACSVLFEIGNSADAFLVLRAQERGVSVVGLLWMLLAFNVVYTLVSTPAGFLADRVPRKWVVCGGWCIYALVYLGFALVNSSTQVTLLYMIYGVYHGLVAGAAKALVADLVPRRTERDRVRCIRCRRGTRQPSSVSPGRCALAGARCVERLRCCSTFLVRCSDSSSSNSSAISHCPG